MTPNVPLSSASKRTRPPAISELMRLALANPDLISLAAGFVDQASLPYETTGRAIAAMLSDPIEGRRALQYGTTQGDPRLRRELLKHLERDQGVEPGTYAELLPRTVVTTGSAQLLYLVAEILIDPGDIVIAESPTYFCFLEALETRGARVIGVNIDDGGMKLDALEATFREIEARGELHRVKLVYSITEHSNPSGISLAEDRRPKLVEAVKRWSKSQRIFLFEDAAYRGLNYEGPEPPSAWKSDAEGDTVILARSFSKTYSPGLKIGWGVLPPSLVAPLVDMKGNHDFGTSHFHQQLLSNLLAEGAYERQIATLTPVYRKKRDVMLKALAEHLGPLDPGIKWTHPKGGMFVWLTVPEGVDLSAGGPVVGRCLEHGVIYVPGTLAIPPEPGPIPTNHARLCFGVPNESALVEGVKRLAAALSECLVPAGTG